jgi:predicted Zn-dependent peptidase
MTEPDPYAHGPITVPDALLDTSGFTDLAATTALVRADRAAQAFRDALDELLHSGQYVEEARRANEQLIALAAGAMGVKIHIPADIAERHGLDDGGGE